MIDGKLYLPLFVERLTFPAAPSRVGHLLAALRPHGARPCAGRRARRTCRAVGCTPDSCGLRHRQDPSPLCCPAAPVHQNLYIYIFIIPI